MQSLGILLELCLLKVCSANVTHDPVIQTNNGLVKGKLEYSRYGRQFSAFKGIPYAKPPVDKLRFKAPIEPDNWDKVRVVKDEAPHCLQKNYLFANPRVEGSEDCLYLNVFSPKVIVKRNAHTHLLPVMVFIHWGGFFAGYSSSDYLGPDYFMDKDVILVTFNYRLGVLGFLSTNDDAAPGNYGLKDQLAVLKWIQKNIQHFGGDNKSVTLFGQSAGAASVNFHMFNPESRKLFHRGISESGSSLSLWAQPQAGTQLVVSRAQGKFVGCGDSENTTFLVECLRKIDGATLVDSGDKFKIFSVDPLNVFMPSIEKKTARNPNPFLNKHPVQYIRNQEFENIPWIIGVVGSEGLIRAEPIIRQVQLLTTLNENFEKLMPSLLALYLSTTSDQIPNLWTEIKDFYFIGNSSVNDEDTSSLKALINVYTDRSFIYSTYQTVLFHHLKGHKDIWFYNFNYTGQHSYGDIFAATDHKVPNFEWGVSHCDELLYLFKSPALFEGTLKNHNDLIMIDNMIELWTNFAIFGHPTPKSTFPKIEWLKIDDSSNNSDPKKIHYLNIGGSYKNDCPPYIGMKYGFYRDRLKFWENIPLLENIPELNETYIVTSQENQI